MGLRSPICEHKGNGLFDRLRTRNRLARPIARYNERMKRLLVLAPMCLAASAFGATDLKLNSIYICDANGAAVTPSLGAPIYYVRANWTVVGTAKPYKVRFTMADVTFDVAVSATAPGSYSWICAFGLPLDGTIPYSVTLDPLATSGETDRTNDSASYTFIPTAPASALEFFNPRRLTGTETSTISWSSGTVNTLQLVLGAPTTGTSQSLQSSTAPGGWASGFAAPFTYPVYGIYYSKPKSPITASRTFVEVASASRINRSLVEAVGWSAITSSLPADVKLYLPSETGIESTDPAITAFVTASLPAGFKTSMTPAQVARRLFTAVSDAVKFQPGTTFGAVNALKSKAADSASMSALYVACLRNVGIPARIVAGWLQTPLAVGLSPAHSWTEFYVPSVGWVPQDVTYRNLLAIPGSNAYYFATVPDLNTRCIVQRGSTFGYGGVTFGSIVNPGIWYTGTTGVAFNAATNFTLTYTP